MLKLLKKYALAAVAYIAVAVALYSSAACYIWLIHQRECPKSLIRVD